MIQVELPQTGGRAEGVMSAGGIFLPASVMDKKPKDNIGKGVVLAVGEKVEEIEAGQEVLYNIHGAREMEVDGQVYYIMNVHEVLAIINNDATGS